MIKYSLLCYECDSKFEGWFPGSKEYTQQKTKKLVQCPACDSHDVDKAVMSPNIGKKSNQKKDIKSMTQTDTMMPASQAPALMNRLNKYITKNFENVGDKFYREAKKNIKGKRDDKFYGTPSKKQVDDLLKDGIDLFHVPKVKDN